MHPDALAPWLRLTLTPGLGGAGSRRLLTALGSPEAVLAAPVAVLTQIVPQRVAQALQQPPVGFDDALARTLAWWQGRDDRESADARALPRHIVTLGDDDYPTDLLQMADPPLLLYALGRAPLASLTAQRSIAIVGSRNPTPQGVRNATAFAQALVESGLTVVSGLALGIDGAAHTGALQATQGECRTVAVVGTGLDRVYPASHRDLARRIADHGLLLSEYPLGTPPLAAHFPRRNRLICGLSRATLVVEAALESGSLITARLAAEQGRDVMAIPGSIHSPQARGCHALIKQGAKLVESVQDVLDEMTWLTPQPDATDLIAENSMPTGAILRFDENDGLLQALGHDPVGLDALQARTGWATAQLQAKLLELELMGDVQRLPGGLFQRMGRA